MQFKQVCHSTVTKLNQVLDPTANQTVNNTKNDNEVSPSTIWPFIKHSTIQIPVNISGKETPYISERYNQGSRYKPKGLQATTHFAHIHMPPICIKLSQKTIDKHMAEYLPIITGNI